MLQAPRSLRFAVTIPIVIAVLIIGAANFARRDGFHPYVTFQPTDSLQIALLRDSEGSRSQCEATANRLVTALMKSCPTCRLLENRCVDSLSPQQRKILKGDAVDVPVMRVPNGAVAFMGSSPAVALLACQESERQTAQTIGGEVQCISVAKGLTSSAHGGERSGIFALNSAPVAVGLGAAGLAIAPFLAYIALVVVSRRRQSFGNEGEAQTLGTQPVDIDIKSMFSDGTKRAIDICIALMCICIAAPALVLIPLLIKVVDFHCPVFVRVPAVGKGGRLFYMYKFSSMVPNAHIILADLLANHAELRRQWEQDVKLTKDPRLLPVIGEFLRKFSLNELPQLWNVIKGDMSVVGPRPISREEEKKYIEFGSPELLRARHSIRPGITGLWQISGRNNTSYRDRVLIDGQYLRNRSLYLDLKILFRTAVTVVRGIGAY